MSNDFWEVIFQRRSIRKYRNIPVSKDLLEKILQAAAAAPSAHNSQPWHFVLVISQGVRKALAESMASKYAHDLAMQGFSSETIETKTQRSIGIFSDAAVLIVAFLVLERLTREEGLSAEKERLMATQSVALACAQLMLAASAVGLSTCWFSAPLYCKNEIVNNLCVSSQWEPQAIITLGYAAEKAGPKTLLALNQIRSYR